MEVAANTTQYMTFPHEETGLTSSSFNIRIIKNGEHLKDIGYSIRETYPYIYTVQFVNDGTDFSTWTCIASTLNYPDIYYIETWYVRELTLEKNVRQIRSMADFDGGFFKGSPR